MLSVEYMQGCTSHVTADASEGLRRLSEADQVFVKEHEIVTSAHASYVRVQTDVMIQALSAPSVEVNRT
jgi:hypothetical protein